MNKLPFVWELEHNGVVSHAIGAPNVNSMPGPENYTKDILSYLDDKHLVFVESSIPYGGTLEAAVVDIARAMELTIKCVSPEHESKAFYKHYAKRINTKEAADAYKKGDDAELKKMYGLPMAQHSAINNDIVIRSLRFLKALPTLLTVNLAHFLVEPSLLKMYEEKGIKIKKVQ